MVGKGKYILAGIVAAACIAALAAYGLSRNAPGAPGGNAASSASAAEGGGPIGTDTSAEQNTAAVAGGARTSEAPEALLGQGGESEKRESATAGKSFGVDTEQAGASGTGGGDTGGQSKDRSGSSPENTNSGAAEVNNGADRNSAGQSSGEDKNNESGDEPEKETPGVRDEDRETPTIVELPEVPIG